ncbi:hypothetical protein JIR001_30980 [Polycladomyces abyssicola]|uniref:Uncharacterized protein n=1 Tax=Polycladomyces abyssicola TaxID=1125966 RepID=A0A8D5UHF0_9BACL|nr:hypothetical protein [Polycladomyces abyssicola]BCU83315.1 hypothetical protein JIR001_30980 [Polycladomyces abyssicola]
MGVLYDIAQLAKKNDVRARIMLRTMLLSNLTNVPLQKHPRLNHAKHQPAARVLDRTTCDGVQSELFAKKTF